MRVSSVISMTAYAVSAIRCQLAVLPRPGAWYRYPDLVKQVVFNSFSSARRRYGNALDPPIQARGQELIDEPSFRLGSDGRCGD
jgi:hypothetical protein